MKLSRNYQKILHDNSEYILDSVHLSHITAITEDNEYRSFVISECKIVVDSLNDVKAFKYSPILCVYKVNEEYLPATKSVIVKENIIVGKLCECSGITEETLFSLNKTRRREEVYARQIHMAVSRLLIGRSLKSSASIYGLDHATTINSIKQVRNLVETDKEYMLVYRPAFDAIVEEFGYSAVRKFGLQKYYPNVKKETQDIVLLKNVS